MKIYSIRWNTILISGRASELVLVIVSLNGLPQMACTIWPSIEGVNSNDADMIRNESNTVSMNTQ